MSTRSSKAAIDSNVEENPAPQNAKSTGDAYVEPESLESVHAPNVESDEGSMRDFVVSSTVPENVTHRTTYTQCYSESSNTQTG